VTGEFSTIADIVFVAFAVLTLVPAFFVVLSKNVLHSAVALLFSLLGVAALYVLLGADFLAATQLLIYVGGVLVLLLFGVMLTRRVYDVKFVATSIQRLPAAIICIVIFGFLYVVIRRTAWPLLMEKGMEPTSKEIGRQLMVDFLLPFEVASVLLLVALVGAALLARRD